jgi:hypothetical protein
LKRAGVDPALFLTSPLTRRWRCHPLPSPLPQRERELGATPRSLVGRAQWPEWARAGGEGVREVARRRRHWAHVHKDGMNSISIKCIRCLSLLSKGLPAKKLETLDTDTISRRWGQVSSLAWVSLWGVAPWCGPVLWRGLGYPGRKHRASTHRPATRQWRASRPSGDGDSARRSSRCRTSSQRRLGQTLTANGTVPQQGRFACCRQADHRNLGSG